MTNPVYTTIFTADRGEVDIMVVAEHTDQTIDFNSANIYSVWASEAEPLGHFTRQGDGELFYYGSALNKEAYEQVAFFIFSYREGDWDL